MTSRELYKYVMEEIGAIDCEKVRCKYSTGGKKWLKCISRCIVQVWAPSEASNQLIGRAARLLYLELKNIVS